MSEIFDIISIVLTIIGLSLAFISFLIDLKLKIFLPRFRLKRKLKNYKKKRFDEKEGIRARDLSYIKSTT